MSLPTFAFIIVNFRTPQLVIDCIQTIADQVQHGDEIVVVDNCSGDDSTHIIEQAIIKKKWENLVTVIQATVNGGFSAGNNLGIQGATADVCWLTNSDTLFRPGAVQTMRQTVAANPNVGMFAPRLEWPDGRPQISTFRFHTPLGELLAGANTGPITNLFPQTVVPIDIEAETLFPEWVSFASVVIRAETFEQVGLMDSGFFMYFEDVDYCQRAAEAGSGALFDSATKVVHLRGGTSDVKAKTANLEQRPAYYYAARSRYFAKHYGWLGLLWANFLWMAGRCIAWLRETVGRKKPHTCQHEGADIWTNFWNPVAVTQAENHG